MQGTWDSSKLGVSRVATRIEFGIHLLYIANQPLKLESQFGTDDSDNESVTVGPVGLADSRG